MLTLKIYFANSGQAVTATQRRLFLNHNPGWTWVVEGEVLAVSRSIENINNTRQHWPIELSGHPKTRVEVGFENALLPVSLRHADQSPFLESGIVTYNQNRDLPAIYHLTPDVRNKTLKAWVQGADAEGDDACGKFCQLLWVVETKVRIARKLHQMRMFMSKNPDAVERLHREVLELVASFR